jgi:hypothetical protein
MVLFYQTRPTSQSLPCTKMSWKIDWHASGF